MKALKILGIIAVAAGLIGLGVFYWDNLRGIGPVIKSPPQDITDASFNTTGLPLSLPPGFSISVFAKDLPGARVVAMSKDGMWVSQTSKGQISFLGVKDGKVIGQKAILENLRKPHGLAFDLLDPNILYVAEEHQINRFDLSRSASRRTTLPRPGEGLGERSKIADLPSGGGHFTRTIRFGPDGRLYISIGSSCNVCIEKDARRAAIYSMNKDGSDFKLYAKGLRNAVFFDWSYVDGRMWATEMGRDYLGDNLPPDEINIIQEGQNYGWPICYGKNVHDTNFDKNVYIQDPCNDKIGSYVDLQAHSAPLGLAFVPEEGWPEEYWYDLLVAYHGSWNRSEPTGYKVVRIKLDEHGNYEGTEDFITGWLMPEGALGRPVDILTQPGGLMYISDDKAGVIYKVTYRGKENEDLIHVNAPAANSVIKSPLLVRGKARGTWYFEASFPVRLLDGSGQQISLGVAAAQGEWMTEEFVPFEVKLGFEQPQTDTGVLVLEKDNPSGLPENAAELRIPVRFR